MTAQRLRSAAASLLLLGLGTSGASAAVYRCGNSYTDVPCPRAAVLEVDDSRSDADRAAARTVADREATLAARMVADRERAERLLRPAAPVRVRAPARAASAVAAPRRASRDRLRADVDGNFVAIVPRKR